MISDYLKIAIRNIKNRRLRSWLTLIGIFIGIAALVSLISLGEGLRTAIDSQFSFLGTDIITVTASGGFGPPGTGATNPLTDKELNEVKRTKGIEGGAGRIIESGKIVFNEKADITFIGSMPDKEDRELIEDALTLEAQKGRLLKDGERSNIVLGHDFLQKDNGFEKPITPGTKVLIQDKKFTVVGILEKKGNFQLDKSIFMNEVDMRTMFNRPSNEYDFIAAKFDENINLDRLTEDLEKNLRKVRDVKEGEEDFSVDTPQSIVETVGSILLGIQIFIYIIASISLLVGGIGIMNTMYTAVIERTKEIGIMKSIGAKNSTIFTLFFLESGFLGAFGGLIGVAIGAGVALGLAKIGSTILGSNLISAEITLPLVIGAFLFSFILGSLFGTLPAIQASKLNPVEALRHVK
tara:strand:- start:4541 stop:5764 length:1224 start_codon:yes stop_codon:yes gene_type:complete